MKSTWLIEALDVPSTRVLKRWGMPASLEELCLTNGLSTIGDIVTHYLAYGNFNQLYGIQQTDADLMHKIVVGLFDPNSALCIVNILPLRDSEQFHNEDEIHTTVLDQSSSDEHFKDKFLRYLEGFSVRAQNRVQLLIGQEGGDVRRVLTLLKLYSPGFRQMSGVGVKTAGELQDFIALFNEPDINNTITHPAEWIAKGLSRILGHPPEVIASTFFLAWDEQSQKIDILHLISLLFDKHLLCEARQALILRSRTNWFKDRVSRTLEEIGQLLGLTRERVRQLSLPERCTEPFLRKLRQVCTILQEFAHGAEYYGLNTKSNVQLIESGTQHSHSLDSSLIAYVLTATWPGYISIPRDLGNHDFKGVYLVRRNAVKDADMESFVSMIKFRLIRNRMTTEVLKLDKIFPAYVYPEVREICDFLLTEELALHVENGCVVFSPGFAKRYQKLYHLLKEADKPLHVNDLFRIISERFPGAFVTLQDMHSTLTHYSESFLLTGRSTYGLREWEHERKLVGGTIKGLIVRHLKKAPEPCHIFEITSAVLEHRNSSMESIRSIIALDAKGTFHNYGNGFYGLTAEDYRYSLKSFNPIPGNLVRIIKEKFFENEGGKSDHDIVEEVSREFELLPVQVKYIVHRMDEIKKRRDGKG